MRTQLVVVAGLKAAGKTTIAEAIAQRERIPYFAIDKLKKDLLPRVFHEVFASKEDIHQFALNLLNEQLRLGVSVVIEGEFITHEIRQQLSELALKHGAEFCPIYLTVHDDAEWQKRIIINLENADPDATFTGWQELVNMRRFYAPWPESTLELDTAQPLEENYARIHDYLSSTVHPPYPDTLA